MYVLGADPVRVLSLVRPFMSVLPEISAPERKGTLCALTLSAIPAARHVDRDRAGHLPGVFADSLVRYHV